MTLTSNHNNRFRVLSLTSQLACGTRVSNAAIHTLTTLRWSRALHMSSIERPIKWISVSDSSSINVLFNHAYKPVLTLRRETRPFGGSANTDVTFDCRTQAKAYSPLRCWSILGSSWKSCHQTTSRYYYLATRRLE